MGIFMGCFTQDPDECERVWNRRNPEWMDVMLGTRTRFSEEKSPLVKNVDDYYQRKIDKLVSHWVGHGEQPLNNQDWELGYREVNNFFKSAFERQVDDYAYEGRIPEHGFISIVLKSAMKYLDWCDKNGYQLSTPQAFKLRELQVALRKKEAKIKHVRTLSRGSDVEM